jgi:hypothetical protein
MCELSVSFPNLGRWDDPTGTADGKQLATVPSTMVLAKQKPSRAVHVTVPVTGPAAAAAASVNAGADEHCVVCNGKTVHTCAHCSVYVHNVAMSCGVSLSGGDGSAPGDLVCPACFKERAQELTAAHSSIDSSSSESDSDSGPKQKRYPTTTSI